MSPRLGYILGLYPHFTNTFVLREIEGMRQRGWEVQLFAVKRAQRPELESAFGSAGGACVFARPDSLLPHVWENLRALVLHPLRYGRLWRLALREVPRLSPPELLRLLYHFFCAVGFCREFRRRGITHLHGHFTAATNVALGAHLYDGMPFSFTAHASGDIFMLPVLLDAKVAQATFVIPVCDYSRRYLDAVTEYRHSHKLRRVYNGVDPREPTRLGMGGDDPPAASPAAGLRVVSVGSLVGVKGHDLLIEVCGALERQGQVVQCEIIGDGPERPVLERLIEREGVAHRVRLLGALPLAQVYQRMGQADVFVLLCQVSVNGYRDGFPTAILEAMAAGLPVVSTWLTGIPEMVVDGETGILVPERNPAAAVEALLQLRDRALRQRMGEAGRQRVLDCFDAERVAGQRDGVFRAALNGGSTPSALADA